MRDFQRFTSLHLNLFFYWVVFKGFEHVRLNTLKTDFPNMQEQYLLLITLPSRVIEFQKNLLI